MANIPNIMLLIETSRGYGRGLLRGIARFSSLYGPWNIYREPEFYLKKSGGKRQYLFRPDGKAFDGIIMREQPNTKEILDLGIPTVIASYREEHLVDIPRIDVNCRKIGILAAEHFLERGFKNFAYCGFEFMYWSKRRGDSYAERLNEAGCQTHYYHCPKGKSIMAWEAELPILCDWLKSLPKPIGLFTCNDDRGEQIIDACKVADIRLPDDASGGPPQRMRVLGMYRITPMKTQPAGIQRLFSITAERLANTRFRYREMPRKRLTSASGAPTEGCERPGAARGDVCAPSQRGLTAQRTGSRS